MRNTSWNEQVNRRGACIKPRWGLGMADTAYPGWRATRLPWALSYNPVGVPEGAALLKPNRLHNNRLHADAAAPSIKLLAATSRLRWPSEIDQGGAGEPQSVGRQASTSVYRRKGGRLNSSPEAPRICVERQVALGSAVEPSPEKEVHMNKYSLVALKRALSVVGNWTRRYSIAIVWLLSLSHIALAHAHSRDSG